VAHNLVTPADHRPEDVRPALEKSLAALGTDYVDLWLMHYPCALDPDTEEIKVIDVDYVDTWRAMEECVRAGLARNIGVSSMLRWGCADQTSRGASSSASSPPRASGPHCTSSSATRTSRRTRSWRTTRRCACHIAELRQIGMHVTAYSPLGNTNPSYDEQNTLPPIQENAAVKRVAAKYGISPANVLISLQLSEGLSVLPKSVTPARIEQNLTVVQLAPEDIAAIYESTKGLRHRYCDWSEVIGYKYYADLDDSD
jgi:diketogulonate reductase-like aldo/keto reductase